VCQKTQGFAGSPVDKSGNIYGVESAKNRIRKITPDGVTTTAVNRQASSIAIDSAGNLSSTAPFSALTLRSLVNDRNEFLMTTFPVADSTRSAPAPIVFPQILDGGGYRSQLILLPTGGQTNSTIKYMNEKGNPLTIGMP
jgi:hypothetical protein